jgi:2-methylisocitrate lyase-like PEP mutase family enzyme
MENLSQSSQQERATQFRQWHHEPPMLLLPNAWDAASARIYAELGFRAVATTSSGIAVSYGYTDGERMSRDDMVAAIRRIAAAVDCPVTADIEMGYGDTVAAKLDTIQQVIAAGAIGINIEDSIKRETPVLADVTAQVELIREIRAAATTSGIPLVINARTDVYLYGTGDAEQRFAEAVRRANAYSAAGADCLFPIGVTDATTIGNLVREVGGPINILAGPQTPTIPELASLGVARVSVGGGLARVALGAVHRAAQELLQRGTFDNMTRDALPSAAFRQLFGD